MTDRAPSRDTTTATAGMITARPLRRNTSTTSTTRKMEMASDRSTSFSEALVAVVRSTPISRSTCDGSWARRRGRAALIRSTVAMTLAPGWRVMRTTMAGLPSTRPIWRTSSTLSMTSDTSDRRITWPSRTAMTRWR